MHVISTYADIVYVAVKNGRVYTRHHDVISKEYKWY